MPRSPATWPQRQARRLAEGERRQRIRRIVLPRNLHARGVEQSLAAAREPAVPSLAHEREIGIAALGGEGDDARPGAQAGRPATAWRIARKNGSSAFRTTRRGVRENPRLGARVLGERGVAIHVVRASR